MKKLLFLSIIALFTVASANVFGQSTGTNPSPGAKHNYSVTANPLSTFLWSVTKAGLTVDALTDAVIASDGTASTDITWAATGLTVGTWYYVHILETTTATGCSNEKVLPVQITLNPFTLNLTAARATSCYADKVSVSLIGNDVQYDHGNAIIVFTVNPSGLSSSYTGYKFDLNLNVPAGYTPTAEYSTNASISGTSVTVTDNSAVTITYTVDNIKVYTNANDAASDKADFTATAIISNGITINGIVENGTGLKTGETAVSRPHTSGITTN